MPTPRGDAFASFQLLGSMRVSIMKHLLLPNPGYCMEKQIMSSRLQATLSWNQAAYRDSDNLSDITDYGSDSSIFHDVGATSKAIEFSPSLAGNS